MGNRHSLHEAWTPWGGQSLAPRIDQAAQAEVGASNCAFVIPFLPYSIRPFRPDLHADQRTRGDVLCPTEDVSKTTQRVAEAS